MKSVISIVCVCVCAGDSWSVLQCQYGAGVIGEHQISKQYRAHHQAVLQRMGQGCQHICRVSGACFCFVVVVVFSGACVTFDHFP